MGYKLSMVVINKQDFGITCKVVKAFLEIWGEEWKELKKMSGQQREVYCLSSAVVIGFGGGLRGEEVFLSSLEGMLKFWKETRLRINQSHVMVTLKERFKGETG